MIKLMNGDCLEKMKLISDNSVDMVLCDLPYQVTPCSWDIMVPFEPLWDSILRVTVRHAPIVLTAIQPFTTALINSKPDMFKYCWVWEKPRPSGFVQAKNKPMVSHEDVLVFSTGVTISEKQTSNRMPYYPQGVTDCRILKTRSTSSESVFKCSGDYAKNYRQTQTNYPRTVLRFANETNVVHPTQKPVKLFEYFIKTYTLEGQTVLDMTMGAGTTCVAAVNTGRKCIGIEMDEKYFDISTERVRDAVRRAKRLKTFGLKLT